MRGWWRWLITCLAVCGLPVLMGLNGCDSPLSIDEDTEIQIGRESALDLEQRYGVVTTPESQVQRVQRIGQSIARISPRPDLPWSFKILDIQEPNALALPGGFIYVTEGLLEMGLTDAELAGVIGHEIAHVTERHGVEAIERAMQYEVLQDLVLGDDDALRTATDLTILYAVQLPRSRENEYVSDAVGARLAYNAGYDPGGILSFMEQLLELQAGRGTTPEWARTHPLTEDRIERLEMIVAEVREQDRPVPVALTDEEKAIAKELAKLDEAHPLVPEDMENANE